MAILQQLDVTLKRVVIGGTFGREGRHSWKGLLDAIDVTMTVPVVVIILLAISNLDRFILDQMSKPHCSRLLMFNLSRSLKMLMLLSQVILHRLLLYFGQCQLQRLHRGLLAGNINQKLKLVLWECLDKIT